MTRQAETGMIQPCSKDGGRQGETEMQGEGEEGNREHLAKRRKSERETNRKMRAAGEMTMIGTTNGEFICTVERNSPGGERRNVLIENSTE